MLSEVCWKILFSLRPKMLWSGAWVYQLPRCLGDVKSQDERVSQLSCCVLDKSKISINLNVGYLC